MLSKNLVGKQFGRLSVVARGENTKNGKSKWVCVCQCGKSKKKQVTSYDLESGKVRSCGCLYKESNKGRNATHSKTGTRLYQIWLSMRQRCECSSASGFANYGGRGVTVCEAWSNFQDFHKWAMSHGYADSLTIDRIDVNGNYCPENCRWVTMKEQQNNRRNNRVVEYGGKKYTLSELAQCLKIRPATLAWRIDHGWKEEEFSLLPNMNNKRIRRNIA